MNIRNMYEKHIYAFQYKEQQRERDYFSFPKRDVLQQVEQMGLLKTENRTLREEKVATENTIKEWRKDIQVALAQIHEKDVIILKLKKANESLEQQKQMLEEQALVEIHEKDMIILKLKKANESLEQEKQILEEQVSSRCCETSDVIIEDKPLKVLDFRKLESEIEDESTVKIVTEAGSPRVRNADAVGDDHDVEGESIMMAKSILKRESSFVPYEKERHRKKSPWTRYFSCFGHKKKRTRTSTITFQERPILFQYDPSDPVAENDLWHPKIK